MSSYKETIDQLLHEYFPGPIFRIRLLDSEYDNVPRYGISTGQEDCAFIQFFDDHIYIEILEKCGINGSQTMHKIDQIALQLENVQYIRLEDESNFEVYPGSNILVDLGIFKILTKGESWYNSLGYFSDTYLQECRQNTQIAEMPLVEFQQMVESMNIDEMRKTYTLDYYQRQLMRLEEKMTSQSTPHLKKQMSRISSIVDNFDSAFQAQVNRFTEKYSRHLDELPSLFPTIFLGESKETMTTKHFYNKLIEIIHQYTPKPEMANWLCQSLAFVRLSNILFYERKLLRKQIRIFNGGFKKQSTMKRNKRKNYSKKRRKI